MIGYQDAVKVNRAGNIGQAINSADDELIGVLDRVIEDADSVSGLCDRIIALAASHGEAS